MHITGRYQSAEPFVKLISHVVYNYILKLFQAKHNISSAPGIHSVSRTT